MNENYNTCVSVSNIAAKNFGLKIPGNYGYDAKTLLESLFGAPYYHYKLSMLNVTI